MVDQPPPPYSVHQQPHGAYYPSTQPGSYSPPQPSSCPPPQSVSYQPSQSRAYPPPAGYPSQQPMYCPQNPGQPGKVGQPYYPSSQSGQQQQSTTVIMAQTVLDQMSYGYDPIQTTCPYCQATIETAVDYVVGAYAWRIIHLIVVIGIFCFPPLLLGVCLIPSCSDECKDAIHVCPNCRQQLARVPR